MPQSLGLPQTSVLKDIGTTDVRETSVSTGTDSTIITNAARIGARIDVATTDSAHIGGTDLTRIDASGDTDAPTIGTIDATTVDSTFWRTCNRYSTSWVLRL